MREFTVMKNGIRICSIFASGNLQALCAVLDVDVFPDCPMHTHQGLLLAKVDIDNYMIFERTDRHAENIAVNINNKRKRKVFKHKVSARVQQLFTLPLLNVEAAHYVV